MEKVERIKRSQFAEFLDITPSTATKTYSRIGKGVTTGSLAYNPTVNDEHYIDEDSGTKLLDGYAPVLGHEQTAYKGNPVFDYVDGLRKKRAIGDDAKTTLLMVYIYDKQSEGVYAAEEQDVIISINEFGGDAGNPVSITFDINFSGDPQVGTATITDGKITFAKQTEQEAE